MKTDKNKIDSNQTTVTPPNPNPKEGSIGKSVSIDEGQNWVNAAQLAGLDKYYDYKLDVSTPLQQEIQGLKIKDTFIAGQDIKHAKVRVMMNEPVKATSNVNDSKQATNVTDSSTESTVTTETSTQTGETATSTASNTTVNVEKDTPEETTITLRRNTSTADASTQTGEVRTSDSKVTVDASTQTGENATAEKDTGIDVTAQGKITLEKDADGNTIFIWKAKDDFVHKINEANEKTGAIRLTVYIEGVTLRDATKDQLNELIKNKKLTVPNKAQLLVTNKERFSFTLDSNKVTVTLPNPEIPKDQGTQTEPTPEETHESTQPSKETEVTTPTTTSEEKETEQTTETTDSTVAKENDPTTSTTTSTTDNAKPVVNNSEDDNKFDNKFDNKPLANTGEALKKHPILSIVGTFLIASGAGLGFWKFRKNQNKSSK